MIGLLIFSLFNSSDAFLFLKAKDAGIGEYEIILAYIGYNLIYALISFPAGVLSDRLGKRKTMIAGLLIFSLTYAGFATMHSSEMLFFCFAAYGVYAALTEGISKAWVGEIADAGDRGVAQGFLRSTTSILSLLSGLLTGLIWTVFSPVAGMLVSAIGILFSVLFWVIFPPNVKA